MQSVALWGQFELSALYGWMHPVVSWAEGAVVALTPLPTPRGGHWSTAAAGGGGGLQAVAEAAHGLIHTHNTHNTRNRCKALETDNGPALATNTLY